VAGLVSVVVFTEQAEQSIAAILKHSCGVVGAVIQPLSHTGKYVLGWIAVQTVPR